jgi:hypothetical protein
MTILRQFTWALLATGALSLAACSEQAVEPTPTATGGDILAAKGGGGKPGGGGDPGSGTPADPAIAYSTGSGCTSRGEAGLRVVDAEGSNNSDITCEVVWDPSWSPDGKSIVFYDLALNQMFVVDVALDAQGHPITQNPRLLGLEEGSSPAWSPQGGVIAYQYFDSQTLYTVPAIGGPSTTVCMGCGMDPTWSPDGSRLAFVTMGGGLKTVTVSTGAIQTLIPDGAFEFVGQPDWSRSGDRIAFMAKLLDGGPRGTYVLDLGTGIHSLVTDLGWPASWSPDDKELVMFNRAKPWNLGVLRVVNSVTGATVRVMAEIRGSKSVGLDWRRCAPGPGCGPGN